MNAKSRILDKDSDPTLRKHIFIKRLVLKRYQKKSNLLLWYHKCFFMYVGFFNYEGYSNVNVVSNVILVARN